MLQSPKTSHMTLYGNIVQLKWQWREVHVSNMPLKELKIFVHGGPLGHRLFIHAITVVKVCEMT